MGLAQGRVGVAHPRVELCEVDVLHLHGPPAGKLLVQVLPGAAERLAHALRLGPQPLSVPASGARQ